MGKKKIIIEVEPYDKFFLGKKLSNAVTEIIKLRLNTYEENERLFIYDKILERLGQSHWFKNTK